MKRRLAALVALLFSFTLSIAPALAAPPSFNYDSPPPNASAVCFVMDTTSGPPYIARPCDSTHTVPVTVAGGVTITGGATADKQDTGNTSLGTIATNSGTQATAANQAAQQAPIAPATATATKAVAIACQYNSSGITPTDGQQFILQCGPKGGLTVSGNVASGAADLGNPVKIGGKYNATPPTFTDGQRGDTQIDAKGSTKIITVDGTGAILDPTTPVQTYGSDTMLNIAAGTASTQVKSSAGTLTRITVNTKGASANVITVYDNTACSGTLIATIDGTSDRDHTFGGTFNTGLCVKSTTGTGADMTVVYR